MKKLATITLSVTMLLLLTACGNDQPAGSSQPAASAANEAPQAEQSAPQQTTVTVKTLDGNRNPIDLTVPYDPKRIAVMDLAALDILDNLGLGDRVVGASKGYIVEYLQRYDSDASLINLGTIREVNLEAVMRSEPDIIFIGGRLAPQYDALSEIAPVYFLANDVKVGVVKSTYNNAMSIASIFGLEGKVSDLMEGYDARIAKIAEFSQGKTAVIGVVTSGSFNVLGNSGRCSLISVEAGFENIGQDAAAAATARRKGNKPPPQRENGAPSPAAGGAPATHGNESSFELLVALNPDYIFALDRDTAIGAKGARLAQEVMDNELVMKTDAHKNGTVVHLARPAVWYMAEGGITALGDMLADLESALLQNK